MAKKRNDQRRVQPTLTSADDAPIGMDQAPVSEAGLKKQLEFYGKIQEQVVDISSQMESIFNTQQQITQESDRQYGIEKKVLNSLGVYANQVKMLSLEKKLLTKHSLEDSNIIKKTISDYQDYNQAAAGVAQKAKELGDYRRKQIPFEDKIRGIQQEITNLQIDQGKGLTKANQERLKNLKTSEDQWKTLSKQEQVNNRIEKIQGGISDLMDGQNSAAGKIFQTLKDIVTNPLTLFTGLLAVGLQRYETMRQRGVQLGEEQDRINKKLAGAGPFQDKILQKATLIKNRFYEMGEGFASSMEGSVDAIVALSDQFGKIDYVTGDLVKTMAELKLSIGLSDESSAKVLDNFMIVNGFSSEAAISMTEMTYQMSEQAGLNPQQVFQDIAAASGDTLATFSGSADELAKSAVTARRLGLTLDDMATVSKGLLDFETSIEKEMEAQLITGIDLNLQKARSLAMQGKEAEAMEEVMKQVGGLDAFNNMQPLKQQALADAVGLTVGQLQKSTAMREKEALHATKKYDLVEKQYALAEKALPLLGKLDVGLGVLERIAKVIGDLFLDVFGAGLADLEKKFFALLESPAFKTGFKNFLFMLKGVIVGIKDAVMGVVGFIDKLSGGAIGGFLKNFASKDFSGSAGTAENWGKTVGKGIAVLLGAKMLLGTSPFTPMYVSMGGGIMGKLMSMFKGGGGGAGKFFKGGQFMPGGGRAPAGGMMSKAGGSAGGMSAALPYVAAAAFIAKGMYDVASLDELSGEAGGTTRAKAQGGLGGAALGAMIGTAILPGIGTAIGAGIGYFGGRMVGEMDRFKSKLDKANDKFAAAEGQLQSAKTEQTMRNMRLEIEASDKVHDAYGALANDIDGFTKNDMATFAQSMLDAGNITKKEYKAAISGSITSIDLLNIAAGGAASQMGVVQMLQDQYVAENLDAKTAQSKVDIGRQTTNLGYLDNITESYIQEKIQSGDGNWYSGNSNTKSGFTSTGASLEIGENSKRMDILVGMMDNLIGKGVYDDAAIRKALLDVRGNAHVYGSAEGQAEDLITMAIGELKADIKAEITDGNTQIISAEKKLLDEAQKLITIDSVMGSTSKGTKGLRVFLDEVENPEKDLAKGGILANGGVTYGPSHAQGGIPTRYGELEGGEAVINKRSTAMFRNELSNLNVAGGGTSFADGGVTGKFAKGGLWGGPAPSAALKEKYPIDGGYGSAWGASAAAKEKYGWGPGWSKYYGNINESGSGIEGIGKDNPLGYVGILTAFKERSKHGRATGAKPEMHNVNPATWQYGLGDNAPDDLTAYGGELDGMYGTGEIDEHGNEKQGWDPGRFFREKTSADKLERLGKKMAEDKRMAEWNARNDRTPSYEDMANFGHIALDVLGFIPVLGEAADLINAGWYAAEGNFPAAALSAAAAIPLAGAFATTAKWAGKGADMAGPIGKVLNKTQKTAAAGFDMTQNSAAYKSVLGSEGAYRKYYKKGKKAYGGAGAVAATTGFDLFDPSTYWNPFAEKEVYEQGGVTPKSPVRKVNDAIIYANGGIIEPHPDDNIIMKKGGITHTPGGDVAPSGGTGRVEQLLEGILSAIQTGGDTYIDGAKVSAAINSANYRV